MTRNAQLLVEMPILLARVLRSIDKVEQPIWLAVSKIYIYIYILHSRYCLDFRKEKLILSIVLNQRSQKQVYMLIPCKKREQS